MQPWEVSVAPVEVEVDPMGLKHVEPRMEAGSEGMANGIGGVVGCQGEGEEEYPVCR